MKRILFTAFIMCFSILSNSLAEKNHNAIIAKPVNSAVGITTGIIHYSKSNYIFALTEENLDKAVNIIAQGDKQAFNAMLQKQQIFIWGKNIEVYIVKSKLTKVKVRKKGAEIEVWTVQEAISSKLTP